MCFDGACVPPDFPLLPRTDAGQGEGEGEGEGEPGIEGDSCANPFALTLGVTVDGNNAGFGDDHEVSTGCAANQPPGNLAPDVVYAIDVPAGQDLRVQVSSTAVEADDRFFMIVKVLTSCAEPPIAGGCESSVVGGVDLAVPNPPAGPLFIMVDGFDIDEVGPFAITATAQ